MPNLDALRHIYKKEEKQALKDYFKFLEFESIGSESDYKSQTLACADWLAKYLQDLGFDIQLWKTEGQPTLFGSYLKAGPDQPTLLIYNHYDVQPVDPLDEWVTGPFNPTIRDGEVYARGAQDNKGQCFYTIQALKALLKLHGTLPINIKLCIEGEEEFGSQALQSILQEKKEELKADYLAIVDLGIEDPNIPSITLGVRGIVCMDVEVEESKGDRHSGVHGGMAYNPLHALVELLSKLRDQNGKITVPCFYDSVQEFNKNELKQIHFDFDAKKYEALYGGKATGGEKEFSPLERAWIRPTLEINGIHGGYGGSGFKTVIPAKAHAKISCRLVPNQDPHHIAELVAKFLKQNKPEGVDVHVNIHPGGGVALRANPDSKVIKAFAKAYEDVFETSCHYIFNGASIPIVSELAKTSGSEVVLLGLGLGTDQIHAPNEHFGLDRLEKGFLIMAQAIEHLKNKG